MEKFKKMKGLNVVRMETASIELSEEQMPKVDEIVERFGFETKEEFFQEAIRDKILELQKKLFFEGTNKIAGKLQEQGITEKEIVKDFDKFKHL